MGHPAFCLGRHAAKPSMPLSRSYIIGIVANQLLYYVGLYGIHFPDLLRQPFNPYGFAVVTAAMVLGFFGMLACQLVSAAWVQDFVSECGRLGAAQRLFPAQSDRMVERYEELRTGSGSILFFMFTAIQFIVIISIYNTLQGNYTVKEMLAVFPSPAGMSLTKLSLAGNNVIIPARESLVSDIPAGDGQTANLFYSVKGGTGSAEHVISPDFFLV
jgi:hypothetical protein